MITRRIKISFGSRSFPLRIAMNKGLSSGVSNPGKISQQHLESGLSDPCVSFSLAFSHGACYNHDAHVP
jgi:hypothetical protein